jgi:hypothetical protein
MYQNVFKGLEDRIAALEAKLKDGPHAAASHSPEDEVCLCHWCRMRRAIGPRPPAPANAHAPAARPTSACGDWWYTAPADANPFIGPAVQGFARPDRPPLTELPEEIEDALDRCWNAAYEVAVADGGLLRRSSAEDDDVAAHDHLRQLLLRYLNG